MPEFMPGLRLSELFFDEVVKPILDGWFPSLRYSAALIGSGSEVLGFDTEMSTDHHWGPRLMLFMSEKDAVRHGEAIDETLCHTLPHSFRGYPTNFSLPDPDDHNTQRLQPTEDGPINHRVEMFTPRDFFMDYLNFDLAHEIEPADWLTFPEQRLCGITAGAVYHDGIGLDAVRERFAYYPHDVWLYLLASGWMRISQDEHLMGRAGVAGDELGSAIIGTRLVRDVMRLCFLMEKQYAPYAKWFGTAFAQLACARQLTPILRQVQLAETWQRREQHLTMAYEIVAEMHNTLGITHPLRARVSRFHNRPFVIIHGKRFAEAIRAQIADPAVQHIADRRLIGSIDQFSDSTDLLSDSLWRTTLRGLYE